MLLLDQRARGIAVLVLGGCTVRKELRPMYRVEMSCQMSIHMSRIHEGF